MKEMKKFKVRFNLGAGENFMKWKVTHPDGEVVYYDPDQVTLVMYDCKLRNQPATAKKINEGANKTVCAWIDCEGVYYYPTANPVGERINYNPRVKPHWTDADGNNLDNRVYDCIFSVNRSLFLKDVK